MTTLKGTKLKMTSLFKDGRAYGVTPVSLDTNADLSVLEAGSLIRISGISKGKGFAGVVKRHNFRGGPATHGQKDKHRSPGSIGSTAPQRVLPGRRMAGRMGNERVTIKNLPLVSVDIENKILMLNGSVPGITGREVEIELPVELVEAGN
ncbi:MAG: 50S ribosomal protein L3 [Candidatus Harrisonbacteria bacterium CG10_big_fil_rev_8_21_14_0_10_49_15]|uniref:50S ribosomal protein L3 n=1 Tax=Candidatus Harrisonbacteria bacterium CG10_big_fil_rev_8_21_14_0_10_49_15 TaxID=1974587 RepID=A0A2H0UKX2_9BACT|nr:MAG: 50S ribosomal protein L3 [Candidatus Harrisonbacteria bacterium CG10_big_fil_rev_8_21_14_0_10_49_15]